MLGVGVLAAFSCTVRGVAAAERGDWGVYGLSGEIERARSALRASRSLRPCISSSSSFLTRSASSRSRWSPNR
jgi:hypothetical protein